jgi:glycosyltransferase involved in cell wall biosynthesis
MQKPMVSIYVPVFNHGKYITQALDSILMQQTQYSYEVFVGDDCSTDNTREILEQWEAKHPGVFTFLYRQTNMHKSVPNNAGDLKRRCKGKYIIALEGDDFWTDPLKLEKQVAFLESHPEYYAVAHNCTVVGEDSLPNGEFYPQCTDKEYTFRHFASEILPGQLTTVLYRNYLLDPDFSAWLTEQPGQPGDRKLYFSLLCHGKVYCMQETMSAYRHIVKGGSSFSATNTYSFSRQESYWQKFMQYAQLIGNDNALKYAEFLYLRCIRHAKRTSHIGAGEARKYKKNIPHLLRAKCLLLKRDVNYRLFHKTLHI